MTKMYNLVHHAMIRADERDAEQRSAFAADEAKRQEAEEQYIRRHMAVAREWVEVELPDLIVAAHRRGESELFLHHPEIPVVALTRVIREDHDELEVVRRVSKQRLSDELPEQDVAGYYVRWDGLKLPPYGQSR